MNEFEVIAKFFRPLAGSGGLNLDDDVASIDLSHAVISKDVLIGGVHFFEDDNPADIARKALRVNVSDIVAKGARPVSYLLGCMFASHTDEAWIKKFTDGLRVDQSLYGLKLLGGDTTRQIRGGPFSVSVTMVGECVSPMVRRDGASAGDPVYVSGTIGDSGLGLALRRKEFSLSPKWADWLLDRYALPQPRIDLADSVARFASASMDISDGLFADADHLATASGVTIQCNIEAIPISVAANVWLEKQTDKTAARLLLGSFGDDYEILCTVSPENEEAFKLSAQNANVSVTRIGQCVAARRSAVEIYTRTGERLLAEKTGFNHFQDD